jgi:hypothetical protein
LSQPSNGNIVVFVTGFFIFFPGRHYHTKTDEEIGVGTAVLTS